ncbi:MAG: hypothetical protein P4L49_11725 [Desulfosporosinus sp.]|nr:hypothetical protein [Desulfosporosinus sp.]
MSNQWGRQPMGKDSWTLVLGIVIIGIIGYLFIPNFFKSINSSTDPAVTTTSPNTVNSSSTSDPNALNSAGYPIQSTPGINNALNNGNNEIATGYWVLFLYNGTIQQLPVNAQTYAFVQGVINGDTKGTPTNPIFLVENGQIQKYVVSNETYSILSNMATINKRSSTSSPDTNQTPSPNTNQTPSPNTNQTPSPNTNQTPSPDTNQTPSPTTPATN